MSCVVQHSSSGLFPTLVSFCSCPTPLKTLECILRIRTTRVSPLGHRSSSTALSLCALDHRTNLNSRDLYIPHLLSSFACTSSIWHIFDFWPVSFCLERQYFMHHRKERRSAIHRCDNLSLTVPARQHLRAQFSMCSPLYVAQAHYTWISHPAPSALIAKSFKT